MAWIYLAESEESQKPWKDTSSRSLTVNPIRIAKGSFYPAWILDSFLALQCGTTYELCAAPTCPYHWKSSTAVSLAKTLVLQDAERAWAESAADYFSRSFGSLARYNRDSFSWRTSQLLLFEEQNELLANFAGSGMTVAGEFYPLRTWARITGEKDGGYWPTPDTTGGGPSKTGSKVRPSGAKAQIRLNTAVLHRHLWPTPQANKTTESGEIVNADGAIWDGISKPHSKMTRKTDNDGLGRQSQDVADAKVVTEREPTDQADAFADGGRARQEPCSGGWWATEPDVGRVAHGIPRRVDRLRALGNAVVPAQAREAFERLMGFV